MSFSAFGKHLIILFISLGCLGLDCAIAQNVVELRKRLNTAEPDTGRMTTYLKCAKYYISENENEIKAIDSANYFIRLAEQLNKKINQKGAALQLRALEAWDYCVIHHVRTPRQIFSNVISQCRAAADPENEMKAWMYLSEYISVSDTAKAFLLICKQNVVVLAKQVHDSGEELQARTEIADIHLQQGRYDLSEHDLLEITKDPRINTQVEIYTTDLLSGIYITKGNYSKALYYALKTEKIMQAVGDTTFAVNLYGRLAIINGDLGKPDQSIFYCKKALAYCAALKQFDFVFKIGSSVVSYLIDEKKGEQALAFIKGLKSKYPFTDPDDAILVQKDIGNCYYFLKNYAMAEKSYLEMIRLGERANPVYFHMDERSINYSIIGKLYVEKGDYQKGKKYLTSALATSTQEGTAVHIQSVYLFLFKADSALGNYVTAIRELQSSDKLKNSIFNISKNKQIEELQLAYNIDKNNKNLKISEGKAKVEQVKAASAVNTRNWIIAGSALLLIVAGLLFRQSNVRKRTNELIIHKNRLLQQLVTEKEWLLKEVHHRVKNNLHTVICLLESQAAYLENDALKAIENSQHRIYAMSLIHQKLYQSDDIKIIDMRNYVVEFVEYLKDSFGNPANIRIHLNIEQINLGASQAIPIGLILNEALTNALKYAFPINRRGDIHIELQSTGENIILTIIDNGIGMEPRPEEETGSLGLNLMRGLAKELKGNIKFESEYGTEITLTFAIDTLNTQYIAIEHDEEVV
jgi:two-component sensor histidine kinase